MLGNSLAHHNTQYVPINNQVGNAGIENASSENRSVTNESENISQQNQVTPVEESESFFWTLLRFILWIAVISGVGVRRYYEKLGYQLTGEGQFMIKSLPPSNLLARDNWLWVPSSAECSEFWEPWVAKEEEMSLLAERAKKIRVTRLFAQQRRNMIIAAVLAVVVVVLAMGWRNVSQL